MAHRLDPLLRPRSIAVLGATERPNSVGLRTVHNLLAGGYEGRLYAVNPGRESVLGLECYPNLEALPETVDHVAFAISDARFEAALEDVIGHGARAATIMSQLVLRDDEPPTLLERVGARLSDAELLVCGGNAMGFYNCREGVWMCGFDTRENHVRGGNVTLISHSGAGMSGIVDCEERIDFNLAVSTGQELTVAMPDYMDFAIEAHETRVIGLFMETVRDPEAMRAVLEKANAHEVPVVAIKVGCTELSARLAASHSGAMAGADAAYEALFDRYGVTRVYDMDEFTTALIMFAQPHPVADGGLVSIHDSGGERQLLIDLADRMDAPLATVSDATTAELERLLDPGLPAVNPLDAWGAGGTDSDRIMEQCLAALMRDPNAAMGAVIHDRAPHSTIYPEYYGYLRAGHQASGKPVFLVSNHQGSGMDPSVVEMTREGFPVLDGLRPFLTGVKALTEYRRFCAEPPVAPQAPERGALERARSLIEGHGEPDEFLSGRILEALGMPVNPARIATSEEETLEAARSLGFPVVVKTAEPGIRHKTERRGVLLGLEDHAAVSWAYRELARRLGPRVQVSPMVREEGLELVLGMIRDRQFGPLVLMGLGGVRIEALDDVVYALPPFDARSARRLLDRLKLSALLGFDRGRGTPDLLSFCEAAATFSSAVALLGDVIEEIDMNPLIVHAGGCVAVDALVIARRPGGHNTQSRQAS